MREVRWSFDARSDLVEIVSFIQQNSGSTIARQIYERIQGKVKRAADYPEGYRIVPELQEIGVFEVREIIESSWRIFFRSSPTEVRILSVIDGRRNVQEVLYKKMIDGKLTS